MHGYRRIQNVLKVFAKLIIDDDKGLFHFECSNGIKCTYIKVDNWFELEITYIHTCIHTHIHT